MCKNCELAPVYEFTNKRKVCRTCYVRWFQKKIFYTIRKFEMIKPGEIILSQKKNDFRSAVLEDVLKSLAENERIKIILRGRHDKLAVSDTIDLISYKIINTIIQDNILNLKNLKPLSKNTIRPFYLFLDKEILLYAKLKNLRFKIINEKKDKIADFIDGLEKKHPEVKRAIVNGFLDYE